MPAETEATFDAAITTADTAGAPSTVTLTGDVTETMAAPDVTTTTANELTIDGAGFTLTGDGTDAALRVGTNGAGMTNAAAALTIENINIANTGTAAAINNVGTLTITDDGAVTTSTISAPIIGSGVVNVFGSEANDADTTVIFGGLNAYTGATTIGSGNGYDATVVLGTNGSIAMSSAVTVNEDGLLDVSSVQTATGAASTVAIHDLSGSGDVYLGQNTLSVVESAAGTTFSGDIYGGATGGLTLTSGSLTLSGENEYQGSTRISGVLHLANGYGIESSANVALKVTGAQLDISTAEEGVAFINQLTGVAGSQITLGANELFINEDVGAASFSGTIVGTGGILVEGSAQLTLNGANSYSGGTNVEGGSLALGASGSIGTGYLEVDSGGAFDASAVTAGSITVAGLYGEGVGTIALGSNRLIIDSPTDEGGNSNFDGVISGSGAVQIGSPATTGANATPADAAVVTLSGANLYTGSTVVYGTLDLTGAGSIAASANVGLRAAGATLDVSAANGTTATINNATTPTTATFINQLTGVAGSTVALGTHNLVVTETGSASFSGAITGSGDFVVRGPGTLTLSETAATGVAAPTAFTGTVVVGGHLSVANTTELVDAGLADNGNVDISAALSSTAGLGTASVEVASLSGASVGNLTLGANTLVVTGGTNETSGTFAGAISGSGGLTVGMTGAGNGGALTLTGASTYMGATTIGTSGNLTLAGGSISDTSAIVDNGRLQFEGTSGTVSAAISGTGSLLAGSLFTPGAPSGSLTLTGADTYAGSTTVENATLTIGAGGSIAASSGVTLIGGTLDLSGAGGTQSIKALTTSTNILLPTTAPNTVSLGATNLLLTGTSATATAPGVGAAPAAFTGVISGTTGQLQIGAHAGLNLAAAETYTGSTVIFGSLFLTGAASIADSANVSLKATTGATTADGLFDISGTTATSVAINQLTGQGGTLINLGSHTLVVDETGAASYSGVVEGAGGLEVDGAAYLSLNGANSYTGTTAIDATGHLQLGTTSGSSVQGSIAASSGLVDDGFFAIAANASVNDLSGTGVVKMVANTLTVTETGEGTTFSGIIHGPGGVLNLAGGGELTLSGSMSDYSGGTHLNGGVGLHLEAMNAAGTGAITFEAASATNGNVGQDSLLQIDNAALTGGNTATESFANAIDGLANGGTVDLTGLAFSTATTGAGQTFTVGTGGALTIVEGNVHVTFQTDLAAGSTVQAGEDNGSGTDFFFAGAAPAVAADAHQAYLSHMTVTH